MSREVAEIAGKKRTFLLDLAVFRHQWMRKGYSCEKASDIPLFVLLPVY